MWNPEKLMLFNGAIYRKIVALIEYYLEQGVLVAGEKLPAERLLAKALNVNRSTVVRAYEELTEYGIIIRKRGSGTFVNEKKWGLPIRPSITWNLPKRVVRCQPLYQQKVKLLRESSGLPFLDLASGDLPVELIPDLTLPSLSIQELIRQEFNTLSLSYGLPSLRQQIVAYMYHHFGFNVAEEEILITSGTQQSLFLITQCLLKPGDTVAIESPSYFYALPLFQAAGIKICAIKCDEHGICIDDLSSVASNCRINYLFINPIFQNPTSTVLPLVRRQALLRFCRKKGISIIEDDACSILRFESDLDVSPLKKLDKYNNVIYLGTLSKLIGRNIRLGWLIAPVAIINKLAETRQHIDSGLSVLPQLLAEHYLKYQHITHYRFLIKILLEKMQFTQTWLSECVKQQISYSLPKGGLYFYLKLKEHSEQYEFAFLNKLLSERITALPCTDFGDHYGRIRINFAHFKPLNIG